MQKRHPACCHLSMDDQPPRDDDPSDMTDFEKNATSEELEQLVEQEASVPSADRIKPERGQEPDTRPGF